MLGLSCSLQGMLQRRHFLLYLFGGLCPTDIDSTQEMSRAVGVMFRLGFYRLLFTNLSHTVDVVEILSN